MQRSFAFTSFVSTTWSIATTGKDTQKLLYSWTDLCLYLSIHNKLEIFISTWPEISTSKSSPCDKLFSIIPYTAPGILQCFWAKFFDKEQKNPQGMTTRDTLCSFMLREVVGSRGLVRIKVPCVYAMVQLDSKICGFDGVTFIYAE